MRESRLDRFAEVRNLRSARWISLRAVRQLRRDEVWHSVCGIYPIRRAFAPQLSARGTAGSRVHPGRKSEPTLKKQKWLVPLLVISVVAFFGFSDVIRADFGRAKDPGPRGGVSAGAALTGLTGDEQEMFDVGQEDFSEEEGVTDGLGPRFNFVGCRGCHVHPATGGSSPAVSPLFRVPVDPGFTGNVVPSLINPNGPTLAAAYPRDPAGSRDGRAPGP